MWHRHRGRNAPASGKHHFDDVSIADCEQAIAFLPGFQDDSGQFNEGQVHADESLYGRISIFNCGRAIVSRNEQAVWHHFQHLQVGGGSEPTDVIFDVERGGLWKVDVLTVGVMNTTVIRVTDFSQNTSRFDIDALYRDHFEAPAIPITAATNASPIVVTCSPHQFRTGMQVRIAGVTGNTSANGVWTVTVPPGSTDAIALDGSAGNGKYLGGGTATPAQRITLFEFAGKNPQPWMRWNIRIDGHFSELPVPQTGYGTAGEPTWKNGYQFATSDIVKLNGLTLDPSGGYGTSILFDIHNLPAWVAAKYWPHGAYRLTAAERDLIAEPYPGLTVWVLDLPPRGQTSPSGVGHYETWDGKQWKQANGPQ